LDQKRAYVLADNQLAITGSGWDPELLRLELGELKLTGFDLTLTGFDDIGDVPEVPQDHAARAGHEVVTVRERLTRRKAPTLPLCRVGARTRARLPEIKGRGRPIRSSGGRSIG
jgi:hypothetical protein